MRKKQSPTIVHVEQNKELFSRYEKVWLDAWCSVARASNSTSTDSAKNWADSCLKAFKERFDVKSSSDN